MPLDTRSAGQLTGLYASRASSHLQLQYFPGELNDAGSTAGLRARDFRGHGTHVQMWKPVRGYPLQMNAELLLELQQVASLLSLEQSRGCAAIPGAAGPADAMDEILGDFRQVVIDDVSDVVDVNSA